jgi:chemotaxis response regulator CheB
MQERKTVVVYGNSLFSAGIETSLRSGQGFLVVQIESTQPDAAQHIAVLQPDVLVVDVTTTPWEDTLHHLRHDSTMVVLGINPHTSTVTVLRGKQVVLASMHELTALVERHTRHGQAETSDSLDITDEGLE